MSCGQKKGSASFAPFDVRHCPRFFAVRASVARHCLCCETLRTRSSGLLHSACENGSFRPGSEGMTLDSRLESASNSEAARELVLILDFGAQYTQLIARRVRECNVYCEIVPFDTPVETLMARKPRGFILSGGPSSVYEEGAPHADAALYAQGVPVLGICYGQQLMAFQLGGEVRLADRREYGHAELTVLDPMPLFQGIGQAGAKLPCWMSHGDKVLTPPPAFHVVATTPSAPVAAMADPQRHLYGVQFHPEVAHTPFGKELLRAFLYGPCRCHGNWTPANFVEESVRAIREQVGAAGVVCGVSGGIDSCCVAALLH